MQSLLPLPATEQFLRTKNNSSRICCGCSIFQTSLICFGMIELNTKSVAIRLDFSFFAALAFGFFLDTNGIMLMSLAACLIHEMGHLVMMMIFDVRVSSICFYGAGICIGADFDMARLLKKVIILSGGIISNIIMCAVAICSAAYIFAAVNLAIAAFNLLAIGNLDGCKIVKAVSDSFRWSDMWLKCFNVISVLIIIAFSLLYGENISISFYATLLYMIFVAS